MIVEFKIYDSLHADKLYYEQKENNVDNAIIWFVKTYPMFSSHFKFRILSKNEPDKITQNEHNVGEITLREKLKTSNVVEWQ